MTDMVIPPEAVGAAAVAACETAYPPKSHKPWDDVDDWERDAWRATVSAALEAALPHLRPLFETATKVGLELGRKEALEEAANLADDLAAGVGNPEKPYNDAFIHACGVVARHIREIGTKETQP